MSVAVEAKTRISEGDGPKWLLYLLSNEHMAVRNEGVVSLSLLASLNSGTIKFYCLPNNYF